MTDAQVEAAYQDRIAYLDRKRELREAVEEDYCGNCDGLGYVVVERVAHGPDKLGECEVCKGTGKKQ